jgi:peroxiredoxin
MSKAQHTFKQYDVTRALKGAVKAGLNVQRYEIDRDGKIVVFTGKQPKHPEIEDATALIG